MLCAFISRSHSRKLLGRPLRLARGFADIYKSIPRTSFAKDSFFHTFETWLKRTMIDNVRVKETRVHDRRLQQEIAK